MAFVLARRARIVPSCRSYHGSARSLSGHGGFQSTPVKVGDPDEEKSASEDAGKTPLPDNLEELNQRFNDIFKLAGAEEDRGMERLERLTRARMHRQPRFQGDFASLEEDHILFGRMGTPKHPVIVYSGYPTRIVGCMGSTDTKQHELLWHIVKREKPCMCLECGQTFQLQTAPGESIVPYHHGSGY